MIQLKDLRIGNLFQDYKGDVVFVLPKTLTDIESGGWADSNYIKLTEEWLKKLEFVNQNGTWEKYIGGCCFEWRINVSLWNGGYLKHIEHLHELQNLYFVLTGEELKL